ncbi:hypothetical protein [Caulobacter sp. NIBR2454]|uniref:hypothetical protein n=1 Tax=Caulobacter sp. NIBR2454 TaxID=3015996 RepID=UPI0022B5F8E2|nr:hypothetical protein [Caulobacter sp. NIBR2454]
MSDRIVLPALALLAAALIGLALVWPQGLGARSPGPFGSRPVQQRPEVQAAIQREEAAAARRAQQEQKEQRIPAPVPQSVPQEPPAPIQPPALREENP